MRGGRGERKTVVREVLRCCSANVTETLTQRPTPNAQRPTPEHNHDPAPHLLVHPGVNARDEHRSPSVVHVDSVALVRPLKAQDAPAALGVRWRGGGGAVITGDFGQF